MALPLIPGFEAARGAPRVETRLRETSSPKPEAEPKVGTAKQERAGAPFGSFLDRASSKRNDDGAQVRPVPRKSEQDESATSTPIEPEATLPVGDEAPAAEGEEASLPSVAVAVTDVAALPVEPGVIGSVALPPPSVEIGAAPSGDHGPRSVSPGVSVRPADAQIQNDSGESTSGQTPRDDSEDQSFADRDRAWSGGSGAGRPVGSGGGESLPRGEVRAEASGGAGQSVSLSEVSAPPLQSAKPEVDPREGSHARASDAPSRSAEAPIRLESALRSESDAPVLSRPSSAPALAKPAGLPGANGGLVESESSPESPQIVARGLSAAAAQRGGVVHVRLVPESLGEVRIQMSMDALSVSVKIEASTPAAQGLLNEHLAMLRSSLESKGLTVDRLAVHLAPPVASSPGSQQSSGSGLGEPGGQTPHHDAGGSPSRGRSDDEAAHGRAAGEPPEEASDEGGSGRSVPAFASRLRVRLSAVA